MARKSSEDLYFGRSGQLATMAEFLSRRSNVAIPEVDVGEDIFVVADKDNEVTRVQVKAANARQTQNGYFAQFKLPLKQLREPDDPRLVYVFVVRPGGQRPGQPDGDDHRHRRRRRQHFHELRRGREQRAAPPGPPPGPHRPRLAVGAGRLVRQPVLQIRGQGRRRGVARFRPVGHGLEAHRFQGPRHVRPAPIRASSSSCIRAMLRSA